MNGLIVVTDRAQARHGLVRTIARAVEGGARRVLLREKDLPADARRALADELRAILAPAGGRLIVAGPDPLGGDAVHLAAAGPYPPPVLPLVGRSCHDEAELARLTTEDYVTVSPIFRTRSKPGYDAELGLTGLARLLGRTAARVVALGGIETAAAARACVDTGAAGVAVMGAVMRAPDPAALVATLIGAVAEPAR
ncbi:thiamine phosphate synthase [Catenuloplanes atrovinosus]|uniref:Thiamine-phosphate diphosphorylase n=1 Tax=Catenuloplanes atrovinosus TaxID=137266 RepID=A0AAE4CCQ8_9ACTN|nr:thiamine phosphate synthase [Catenuloplanes atrovinosus]MDR7279433.1 thiamine-phosphate diphosphorylase [Catenuloplanes atrovinosus]